MSETTLLPPRIDVQEKVYEDRNQKIYRTRAEFDGFTKEYFVCDHGRRAAVVLVRKAELLLTRQYRLLINGLAYEVPGGRIEDDESPADAAARECFEETGVSCSELVPLITYHPSLDIWKNPTYVFYSHVADEASPDSPERRVWVPLSRCSEMIFAGQICDSLSLVAIFAYLARAEHKPEAQATGKSGGPLACAF